MNPKIIKDHKIRTPSLLQSTLPLYTNIPTSGENGGKQAFEKALNTRTLEEKSKIPTWYLMELLDLVLNGNIFEFNNKLYIQKIGTEMGTRVAPTYACLFMGWLEEKLLKNGKTKKMIINVNHVTKVSNVNLVVNHHIKRWTMFMKAIRITDVIFVVIHFLKIVV